MASTKVYSNIATSKVLENRYGVVNNGISSNNWYQHTFSKGDGEVCSPYDGRYQFRSIPPGDMNKLYRKLVDAVNGGTQGELLTAAVEWKKSLDMVTRRTLWILESYKSFRRFDLPAAVEKLSRPVARPASVRVFRKNERGFTSWNRRPKKLRNLPNVTESWLEYWLGWAPAMGDIFNALDVLQRPFPNQHISVATSTVIRERVLFNESGKRGIELFTQSGVVGCYADAQVTNYNLHLLNQMGLINPALTAFHIIPFSFVLNWFVNVQQVLGALTDFAGVSLTNTGTAVYVTREGTVATQTLSFDYSLGKYVWKARNGSIRGFDKRRNPGSLPTPQLTCQFDRLSLTRAATAVSLLVEVFLRKRD